MWGGGEVVEGEGRLRGSTYPACLGLRRTGKKCVSDSKTRKSGCPTHCIWCPGAAMSTHCAYLWQSAGPWSLLSDCPHEILTTESQGAGWQGQRVLQRRTHVRAHRTLPSHHCRDFPCGVLALLCLGLITSWGFSIPVSRNWAPACQDTNMTPS